MGSRVIALAALVLVTSAATYEKGVDVSNHQGSSIDWPQVAGAGYTFAFQKASEGTTFTDATYALNRSGANASGLAVGAYHFARPAGTTDATLAASGIAQADHFVDIAQPRGGDLPPVLDLETAGGLKPPSLVKWTQAWANEVVARTGARPLVYTSPSFWKTALADTTAFALAGSRLWIAHWTAGAAPTVPATNWGGLGWTFWQWSSCQKVAGIPTSCVDVDRAASLATLPAFPSGVPTAATAPSVVGTARAGVKLAAIPGTWNGGKPVSFSYQWQACNGSCTSIPGATLETFTPTTAQVGRALVVLVTATTKSGSASATSPATAVVAAANGATPPALVAVPTLAGTAQVGQTLTATAGTWTGSPTAYAYQWQRCDTTGVCAPIDGATGTTYVITPADAAAAIEVVVTATNTVGSQAATSAPTAAVVEAPVPPATPGSAAAQAGLAGAVATTDAAATVTWQPGAVPVGAVVALTAAPRLTLTLTPAVATLPWPVKITWAAPPTGQVVGFSTDARVWAPVAELQSDALETGLLAGVYGDHLLTRRAGMFRAFVPNAWGDPRLVSKSAPRLRRVAPIKVRRLRSGAFVVSTRLSAPSQVLVLPTRRRVLRPGIFPVTVRIGRNVRTVRITAIDPWGRRAGFALSFRAPHGSP